VFEPPQVAHVAEAPNRNRTGVVRYRQVLAMLRRSAIAPVLASIVPLRLRRRTSVRVRATISCHLQKPPTIRLPNQRQSANRPVLASAASAYCSVLAIDLAAEAPPARTKCRFEPDQVAHVQKPRNPVTERPSSR